MKWYRAAATLLLFSMAAAVVVAGPAEERRIPFSAPVSVAADGSAAVGELEGVADPVATVIRESVAELPYVVATRNGVAVASTVVVDGEVVLVPVGDEFEVAIEHLQTQPRLLAWRPADYPIEMMRKRQDGVVTLVLDVGADGRITDTRVVGTGKRDVAKAAREAAADWRFEPPVAGEPFQVGATFWFHGNWSSPEIPTMPCTIAPQAAHLPGDDGCLRISETTGGVFARGEEPRSLNVARPPAPPSAIARGAGTH